MGIEANEKLLQLCDRRRKNARLSPHGGLEDGVRVFERTRFVCADLRRLEETHPEIVRKASVVYVYLLTEVMQDVAPVLEHALAWGARVVTFMSHLPGREPHDEAFFGMLRLYRGGDVQEWRERD